jgi:hypothetical protein
MSTDEPLRIGVLGAERIPENDPLRAVARTSQGEGA